MNITTIAWKMGRNGEQRGDTMGPFEDGTLADVQWRAGFDALVEAVEFDEDGMMNECPEDADGHGIGCEQCPFTRATCCDPNPPRRT